MLAMAYSLSIPCSKPESVQDEQTDHKSCFVSIRVLYMFLLPVLVPLVEKSKSHSELLYEQLVIR